VWYVYRDGRVRRPHPSLERLYASLAVARTTCEASERAIAGARTVARSAGYGDEARPVDAFEPVIAARPRS
jgi:hypothetical protein